MTKAPILTEKSKKERDNTTNATQNFDYTTIRQRSKIEVSRDVRNSKSGNTTSSGDIGSNCRTNASPKWDRTSFMLDMATAVY